jgi:hypothetical protein
MSRRWLEMAKPLRWAALLVVLGLALRAYHYLRDPSVWHDEAVLIVNVLDLGFTQLLGPLRFAEAAPPLFLWVEKSVSLALGDGTFALRLVPFLASCLSLLLVAAVAWRWLEPGAVPWAVLLFACSNRLLWHGCEAKPYAVDVLAGSVTLAIFCWTQSWPVWRQAILYAVLAPLLIFLCYPGGFLCGGILAALLPAVWRERRVVAWLSYGVLVLVVGTSFLLLLLGPVHAQRCGPMDHCWVGQFANWQRPWTVPGWCVFSTLDLVRYAHEPWGQPLTALAVVGAVSWWRAGYRRRVILAAMPIGLALLAACAHAYPYGGARIVVYAAPATSLLIAAGVGPVFAWLRARHRLAPALLTTVLLAPLGLTLYRVVIPWDRADAVGATEYVLAHRRPGDTIVGNQWEQLYYFRDLGPESEWTEEVPRGSGEPLWVSIWPGQEKSVSLIEDRVWIVAIGKTAAERLRVLQALPPGDWRTLDRREFTHATVFLQGRSSEELASR